jgi:hypothetical protein
MMQFTYPKQLSDNKRFRLDILQKAFNSNELKSLILAKCREDILFFINVFCWTYDPRKNESNVPFITYPYQDKYILDVRKCIDEQIDNFTEKSRDMGFSWMLVVIQVHAMLFLNENSLYGSYKQVYVDQAGNMDSHFERIKYVIGKLPLWMSDNIVSRFMSVSRNGVEIAGDTGENFGTGGRRKFVILDEFAIWQFDQKAFRKTRDISNCRIFGGTPEGRFNLYGKVMTNHIDYNHLNIKKFRLHWSLHPFKTQKWYEEEKLKRTTLDIAKELDISYDESVTGAVYKDFAKIAKFGKFKFNPNLKLYTSWDFGRDMTAIIWVQKDFDTNQLYIIDAFQKENKDIDFFTAFISGIPTPTHSYTEVELKIIEQHKLWSFAYANHFGDPYNADNRNAISENTIAKELKKNNIHLQTKRGSMVRDRITKTTLTFNRLNVNEDLTQFIQSIIQSRYPKVTEKSQQSSEKVNPIHDSNSHFRTSLEYLIDNEPENLGRRSAQYACKMFYNNL